MTPEEHVDPATRTTVSRRARLILAGVCLLLALVPTFIDMAAGVPFREAIGVGDWVAGALGCLVASRVVRRGTS